MPGVYHIAKCGWRENTILWLPKTTTNDSFPLLSSLGPNTRQAIHFSTIKGQWDLSIAAMSAVPWGESRDRQGELLWLALVCLVQAPAWLWKQLKKSSAPTLPAIRLEHGSSRWMWCLFTFLFVQWSLLRCLILTFGLVACNCRDPVFKRDLEDHVPQISSVFLASRNFNW